MFKRSILFFNSGGELILNPSIKGKKMKKFLVIAVLLVFFSGSAYAADWNFYGSARVQTTYTDFDNSPFSTPASVLANTSTYFGKAIPLSVFGSAKGNDTKNYEQKLYGNARIGAKVNVSDELYGHFEFGALGGSANVRILWGEWTFGAGALGIGQNYTPLIMPYSNQTYSINAFNKGDHNMSTFGMLYGSRKAMIRLKFGGFQIAAVEVEPRARVAVKLLDTATPEGYAIPFFAAPATEIKLPSIQAKYKYDFGNGHIAMAAGYQTFDVVSAAKKTSVDSYILALGGRMNFGGMYVKGNVWGGQNVGNMADILVSGALFSTAANAASGTFDGAGWGYAQYDTIADTITDNDALAALLVVGYEIRKGLYLEAGYGYVKTELDMTGSEKDDAETYYLQSTIFLAPGVFLTPEIGRANFKQTDQPDATYFGIKWQINF